MTDLAVQDLYDTDYCAWAMQQADAIERLLQEGSNVPRELFHLPDEVRDLGAPLVLDQLPRPDLTEPWRR